MISNIWKSKNNRVTLISGVLFLIIAFVVIDKQTQEKQLYEDQKLAFTSDIYVILSDCTTLLASADGWGDKITSPDRAGNPYDLSLASLNRLDALLYGMHRYFDAGFRYAKPSMEYNRFMEDGILSPDEIAYFKGIGAELEKIRMQLTDTQLTDNLDDIKPAVKDLTLTALNQAFAPYYEQYGAN